VTAEQLRDVTLHLLRELVPEARCRDLAPDEPLGEALGLDAIDMLNFVIAVHDTFGIDVPESDYSQLDTLGGCVRYLARRRLGP
jgi:acyl carrier protein